MMTKLLATAALLFAACVDNGQPIDTVETDPTTDVAATAPDVQEVALEGSACQQIVATDGPCSAACDPAKLMDYIPEGTCMLFSCALADGSESRLGGCNL